MKNWIEKEQPEECTIQSLKKDLKIDDFICSLLLQRQVNSLKKAQKFFRPDINLLHDPFLMKDMKKVVEKIQNSKDCLLYTSPSPRDGLLSRMPSSA